LFKLILHNVYKHKFLFILIGIMVILLTFYLLIGLNTVFSVSESLVRALSDNLTGDVIITSSGTKRMDIMNKDGEDRIANVAGWEDVLMFLRDLDMVDNASPRLRVWGIIRSDLNIFSMLITGIDPLSDPDLLPNRMLDEGRWLQNSNEINLYFRHSDYLSVFKGDTLGVTVQTLDGYANFDTAELVGILDYQDLEFYTDYIFYAFVSLDYLNSLLMTREKTVSEILVRMKDGRSIEDLRKTVGKQFGNKYRFIYPQESSNLTDGIYKLTFFTVYFVAFLLILMVFLCSSFLVSLSIENRRQEIGIYQAMGVNKWRISLLFAGEFLFVMVIFGFIGIVLGLIAMNNISQFGIQATIIPLRLIFGRATLYIQNHIKTFVMIFGILLVAFLSSVLHTTMKLGKLDPVEVMSEL